VVIDGVMKERVAGSSGLPVALSLLPAHHPVPTAVGDPPELLDVDMHQIARVGVLVSDRSGPAHRQPGGPV
jgi:hypothetical protein